MQYNQYTNWLWNFLHLRSSTPNPSTPTVRRRIARGWFCRWWSWRSVLDVLNGKNMLTNQNQKRKKKRTLVFGILQHKHNNPKCACFCWIVLLLFWFFFWLANSLLQMDFIITVNIKLLTEKNPRWKDLRISSFSNPPIPASWSTDTETWLGSACRRRYCSPDCGIGMMKISGGFFVLKWWILDATKGPKNVCDTKKER